MIQQQRRKRVSRRAVRFVVVGLTFMSLAGCSHKHVDTGEDYRPDPILVHVRNENFLDMNVYAVISGVSRRLGMVTGNGAGDFKISWSVAYGQPIVLRAVPIGGSGSVYSPSLSVGEGQEIEFKIASTLRQSTAIVREP
jgi:hypothetical protein